MTQPVWSTAEGTLGTYYGGSSISYQLVASPVLPATSIRYTLVGGILPPGLHLTSTGLITGTSSSVSNSIQYNFTVRATDNLGAFSSRTFSILLTVAQPVWNTPAGNLAGVASSSEIAPIQLSASAILPATSLTFKVISGSLPTGLSMTTSGLISGTPAQVFENTTFAFVVRITDNLGHIRDRSFSMVVSGVDAPSFSTPNGKILTTLDSVWVEYQVNYSTPITDTPATVRLIQGMLPPGLELNEFGLIRGYADPPYIVVNTGTVTTASIRVENNTIVCYSTNGFVPGRPVQFSGIVIGGVVEGVTYYVHSIIDLNTFTISSTLGSEPITLTDAVGYMVITLPDISTGQPTVRSYDFTLKLESEFGTAVGSYTITVKNQNAPLSIGGPGYLQNTRIPTLLNTRPLSYDISTDPLIYRYYSLPVDSHGNTYPITEPAYIGKYTSDNLFSFKILGYDFDGNELEYIATGLPPGLSIDANTGWITGTPIIADNSISQFGFTAYVRKKNNHSIVSSVFEFTFILKNAVNGVIVWTTPSDLGIINNNTDSILSVNADCEVPLLYELVSGTLPTNLELLSSGEIAGTVAFNASTELLVQGDTTQFTFTIRAFSPQYPIVKSEQTFTLVVAQLFANPMDTVYIKCTPSIADRQLLDSLLTNTTLIPDEYLYRPDDSNFGKSTSVIYNHAYGINASNFDEYIAAVTKNHYWRNITLGQINTAVARDQNTGEILYEVVYSMVYDNLVNYHESTYLVSGQTDLVTPQGTSVSKEVIWPRPIPLNPEHTAYTSIVYPNSLVNMRQQIVDVLGQEENTNIFPLWMTSQQLNGSSLGYIPAWVICYTQPGYSETIKNNINTNWKDVVGRPLALNLINFKIDRFTVNKSMTYDYDTTLIPPAWTELPSASPQPDPIDADDFYVWFPQQTILPDQ